MVLDKPIILEVYDENCSDLTVIDLPGITKVARKDQPKEIV